MPFSSYHKISPEMDSNKWLRRFSKLTCFSTLLLIFVGGMVTSTGSGLAVPDWPLSYGTLFPPMVGGVFYEHGHRLVASCVGFFMLCLAFWLWKVEARKWVRILGCVALGAVILQGLLGGLTVLFFLPTPISVMHGILAQSFFILTIIIAYSQSIERKESERQERTLHVKFLQTILVFILLIYLQLIFGAVMRHTGSGLAVPDVPTMGGYWLPPLNREMLGRINEWRFEQNLDFVNLQQVAFHLLHRMGALFIVTTICILNYASIKCCTENKKVKQTIIILNFLVASQIILGIATVLTIKAPVVTSLHVVNGAAILGTTVLLFLRAAPLSLRTFKREIFTIQ